MEIEVQHSAFNQQRLTVTPAGWFRGPRLFLNGEVVPKKKGVYTVKADAGGETAVRLKYNYLDPIPKLKIADEVVELARPLSWYEYVWISIPITLVFAGGAIGGFVGALGANASGRIFRSNRSRFAKFWLSALVTFGALVAFVVLATGFQMIVGASRK